MKTCVTLREYVNRTVLAMIQQIEHVPRENEHVIFDQIRYKVDSVDWRFNLTENRADVEIYLMKIMDDTRGPGE